MASMISLHLLRGVRAPMLWGAARATLHPNPMISSSDTIYEVLAVMLASIRKLGSARLHLLTEHGRARALLSESLTPFVSAGPLVLSQPTVSNHSRPYASGMPPMEPELTLPDDLSVIARLNPQLRDVMLAHEKHQRLSAKDGLRHRLQDLLKAQQQQQQQQQGDSGGGASSGTSDASMLASRPGGPNVTKTSLARLRVDELRAVLEDENADPRGNKEVLVQRLLGLVSERERQEDHVLPVMEDFKEGIVTRKQVSQQEKRQRRMGQHHATYGISEQALRQAQAAAVEKAEYATIFRPEEVADMLLEARASDVCILDVRKRSPFTDYMVIGTARSQRMVHMMAAGVLHQLKARCWEVAPGVVPTIEGSKEDSEWMLVDAGSVVVHIFLEGYREEFDLEGLWGLPDKSNVRWLEPKQTVHTLNTLRS